MLAAFLHTRSLERRLLAVLGAVALLPVLVATVFHFMRERQSSAHETVGTLGTHTKGLAAEIDVHVGGHRNTVRQIALGVRLRAFVAGGLADRQLGASLTAWLAESRDVSGDFAALYLLDATGRCVLSTEPTFLGQNYAVRPYFREALRGQPFLSDWSIGLTSGEPGIYASAPVPVDGRPAAVVVAKLRVDRLRALVARDSDEGNQVFLLNRHGVLLAHARPELVYRSLAPLPADVLAAVERDRQFAGRPIQPLALEALKRLHDRALVDGQASGTYGFEGVEKVAALARVAALGWTVGVSRPADLVYTHAYGILAESVAVAALGLALAFLLGWRMTRTITEPVARLADSFRAFGDGNLDARAVVEHPEEIGILAIVFNRMAGLIQYHTAELEGKVRDRTAELEGALAEVRALSILDPLTGCFNRRYLEEYLGSELLRARRYGTRVAVLMCDIDHFKLVNDQHGHLAGDHVLQTVAGLLGKQLRHNIDWVARYGGEEFVLVLPEIELPGAIVVAERLRAAVEALAMPWGNTVLRVTASFGATSIKPGVPIELYAVDAVIDTADKLLYQAKQNGRNRVAAG